MEAFQWVIKHWLDLLQSLGIIGGLLFTGVSLKIDDRVRRVQNLLKITEQHRNLWSRLFDNPELNRVIDPHADLDQSRVTPQEELFVLLLVLHLSSVHKALNHGMFTAPEGIDRDIRQFFSTPIPSAVWQKVKSLQDGDFVAFVEKILG